jgi:porin
MPPATPAEAYQMQDTKTADRQMETLLSAPDTTAIADAAVQTEKSETSVVQDAAAPSPHLFGDWFGARAALEAAGITPKATYIWMPVVNASGGSRKQAQQSGQLALAATFDMDKLAGIKGGAFQVTFNYRHGKNINDTNHLNLLQSPEGVFGAGADRARLVARPARLHRTHPRNDQTAPAGGKSRRG